MMSTPAKQSANDLLNRTMNGDSDAAAGLFELVYNELHGLAVGWLNGSAAQATFRPTAIVHEAYLKLVGASSLDVNSQTHFRAIAARAMRQVVCDNVRAKGREKRGGNWDRVTLSGVEGERPLSASDLTEALEQLAELDERAAKVVMMRYFGGMTDEQIAGYLDVTDRTVRNDWRMARAWLRSQLT